MRSINEQMTNKQYQYKFIRVYISLLDAFLNSSLNFRKEEF